MAKASALLVCVFLLGFAAGCPRLNPPAPQSTITQVIVTLPPAGTAPPIDCPVQQGQDEVDLCNDPQHCPAQIQWCVATGTTGQYYVHFTNNTTFNSPLKSIANDFPVNKNPANNNLSCSDIQLPDANKPTKRKYKYEIHIADAQGNYSPTTCADPKVILK